jgi:hypothetical protein
MVIRPLETVDLDGVARLRTLIHSHHPESYDTEWHDSVWRWLKSHPLGNALYRWVAVNDDGQVVGHLAAMPQYYRINGQRITAHTPAEYQVLPKYGFQALTLMREFFRSTENCISVDMLPSVIAVETRLGAEVAGNLRLAAKLSGIRALPNLAESMPVPIQRLTDWGLRGIDRVSSSALLASELKVEELEEFDESFDELFEKVAAVVPCLPEKDAAFLRWRYGPGSPQSPFTIFGVREGKSLLGYAVLRISRAQKGYLFDLTTLPGCHHVAQALLGEASSHFRRAGVHSVTYRFISSATSPRSRDLLRMGLFQSKRRRYAMLVKFTERDLHETANDIARWSYSIGDGEASFWVK